jgi:hypothetical protein
LQFEKIALEAGKRELGSDITDEDVKNLYLTQVCAGIGRLVAGLNSELDLGTGSILHNVLFVQLRGQLGMRMGHEAALEITQHVLEAVESVLTADWEADDEED